MKKQIAVLTAAVAIVATACGSSSKTATTGANIKVPNVPMAKSVGAGEGSLNIIAWGGYAENGSNDPKVDWVTPFEKDSGCKVNVKVGNTSDEMVSLMKSGEYDGVSASGNASLRLMAGGDVAPVNTDLVPNYKDISDFLKNRIWNSANGKMYGIPHGWGANVLLYRTDIVSPAPDSWGVVFDANSPYKGKVTAYDDPMTIADAALYLMKTQPAMGITNPYSLDQKQFDASVALLKVQHGIVGEYWSDYAKYETAVKSGSLVLGTTWQLITNALKADTKVESVLPKEGATGWSDTWMIAAKAKHPNCMYLWMNYITKPEVQAQVAEYFGEAPANQLACNFTSDKTTCDSYHAKDKAYADQIWYWTTPTAKCLDGRSVKCMDYQAWIKAWTEIKG